MNAIQRDNSIDFVKGIAALSVIFLHNMPNRMIFSIGWYGQAVPLFLIVTAYLTYAGFEKGKTMADYYSSSSIKKFALRVMLPFVVVLMLQCCLYKLFGFDLLWQRVIAEGGIGPGSYYPWLFLQCWLVLPLIVWVIDALKVYQSVMLFVMIGVATEWISSVTHINPDLYRLLFYRYLFVIYLACLIRKVDWRINPLMIVLALGSLTFAVVEIYGKHNFEPWFVNQWVGTHWITAFYPILVFLLLMQLYRKFSHAWLANAFAKLGSYSYEIFLCQMVVFSLIEKSRFSFIGNPRIELVAFILVTTVLSVVPIVVYKRLRQ